jgi:uncharacterized protein (DUF58 family)
MFDHQFLQRMQRLPSMARQIGGGLLGLPGDRVPASGAELAEHRDYSPGDDYRRVDWRVCARHDELLVRPVRTASPPPVYFLLDASRSMALSRPPKFDAARQVAAALGYVALAGLAQVGVTVFADGLFDELPPQGPNRGVVALLHFLDGLTPRQQGTSLTEAARRFSLRRQRRGLLVVISDFFDSAGGEPGLEILRRAGYCLRIVQLYDPHDAVPLSPGDADLEDVETGSRWRITLTARQIAAYTECYQRLHHRLRSYAAGRRIPCLQLSATLSEEELTDRAVRGRTAPLEATCQHPAVHSDT